MADITEQTPVSDSDTKIQYYANYYKLNRNCILERVKIISLEKKEEIKLRKALYYQNHKKKIQEKNRLDYQKRKLLLQEPLVELSNDFV